MAIAKRFSVSTRTRTIALLGLSFFLTACGSEEPPVQVPPPAVSYIEIGTQEVGGYSEFVSRTEAFKYVELKARVEGEITKRLFTEGLTVAKDQLLFEIDRERYEASYQEALANIKSKKAEKVRTRRDYKRGLELRPNGFISQSDLDTLASNAEKAAAAEKGAEAALKSAELNLSYTEIRAPFSGAISRVRYNIGNLVGPGSDPLATLLQDDPIYANFQVDETTYITHLQNFSDANSGKRINTTPRADRVVVSLMLPNGRIHGYKGVINYAGLEVDASTGTVSLRAQFPNPTGIIRPGLYTTLILESTAKAKVPVVPQYAVQESQQGKFVLIIDAENKVKSRNITTGRSIGILWVVKTGLKTGDRLVVEGLQKVRSGILVTPIQKYLNTKTGALLTEEQYQAMLAPEPELEPQPQPNTPNNNATSTE